MTQWKLGLAKRMVLPTLSMLIWSTILWLGLTLRLGVVEQHVAGYPNQTQTINLIVFPIIMSVFNLIVIILIKKISISILFIFISLQVPLCIFTLMMAGGGV